MEKKAAAETALLAAREALRAAKAAKATTTQGEKNMRRFYAVETRLHTRQIHAFDSRRLRDEWVALDTSNPHHWPRQAKTRREAQRILDRVMGEPVGAAGLAEVRS
jgi:hypothetical protein